MTVGCAVAVHVRKDGLEVVLGAATQPTSQGFASLLLALVSPQHLVDVEMNLFVGNLGLSEEV